MYNSDDNSYVYKIKISSEISVTLYASKMLMKIISEEDECEKFVRELKQKKNS